ncbi:MAG: hypothetical protein AB7E47_12440 [Desulfovibrionaceae bacterium]
MRQMDCASGFAGSTFFYGKGNTVHVFSKVSIFYAMYGKNTTGMRRLVGHLLIYFVLQKIICKHAGAMGNL